MYGNGVIDSLSGGIAGAKRWNFSFGGLASHEIYKSHLAGIGQWPNEEFAVLPTMLLIEMFLLPFKSFTHIVLNAKIPLAFLWPDRDSSVSAFILTVIIFYATLTNFLTNVCIRSHVDALHGANCEFLTYTAALSPGKHP